MENNVKRPSHIIIKKLFEIKLKQGNEMEKVQLEESNYNIGIYFHKGNHLYRINLQNKTLSECDLSKNKEIIYITSNNNNDSLICVLKNGNIISIDADRNIKHFKNLNITHLTGRKNFQTDNIKIFSSRNLNKFVLVTDIFITLWYKNNLSNFTNDEATGTFYNIIKQNELKRAGISTNKNSNSVICSNVTAVFNNNFYFGSYVRIFDVITETQPKAKETKVTIFDYLFKFDYNSKFRSVPYETYTPFDISSNFYNTEENEDLNDITTRMSTFKITLLENESVFTLANQRILLKSNSQGKILAICTNFNFLRNITIIFMMCESYRFTSCKLYKLIGEKMGKTLEISDIDWVCNEMILVILASCGTFIIMNINFQIIQINDVSNSVLPDDFYYTPMYYNINKPKQNDPTKLVVSKQNNEVMFIYSNIYAICFQFNFTPYESKFTWGKIPLENFDDLLFEVKYYQLYLTSYNNNNYNNDNINNQIGIYANVLDNIKQYLIEMIEVKANRPIGESESTNKEKMQKRLISKEDSNKKNIQKEKGDNKRESQNDIEDNTIKTFVKFIRIFRSVNQLHTTHLGLITQLIEKTHDFFIYLINNKELYIAILFIELCEKYLCEILLLKPHNYKVGDIYTSMQIALFNPIIEENLSFYSFKYINNKLLYSRMRLILIILLLIEFRNSLAIHSNVIYFVLAKIITIKLKQNELIGDILNVAKMIVKNYKYLKGENEKIGKDNFILNSLAMSYKNDIFSNFATPSRERNDINLSFLCEFYSIEEMQTFNIKTEKFCKGEDRLLLKEYIDLNSKHVLQRWIMLFTNYSYIDLFEDIKKYINSNVLQKENESNEYNTINKIVYFNINLYFQTIVIFLQNFFFIMTRKSNYDEPNPVENPSFLIYSNKIIDEYNRIYLPFISPVDIPFIIYHFYIKEANKEQKTLVYEINFSLMKLIESNGKKSNITIEDAFDFIEFLIARGFSYESGSEINKTSIDNNKNNKNIQRYIYSAFLFYFFLIHKLNLIFLLETAQEMILSVLGSLDQTRKKECYELLFVIINGHLRNYLKIEEKQKINYNEGKYLQIILTFMKLIFYKLLREESYEVRMNISDFVQITPNIMKSYLLEGALYYEYKNLNKLLKGGLFSFNKIVDIKIIKSRNICTNYKGLFECLLNDSDIVLNIFNFDYNNFPSDFHSNLKICLNNFLRLCIIPENALNDNNNNNNNNSYIIFSLEEERDYIRKLIYTSMTTSPPYINQSNQNENEKDEESILEMVLLTGIDKIIKGNFENKKNFQFTNNELKLKLISSIKTMLVKFLHLMNGIYLKASILSIDPFKEELQFIKLLSLGLIYENNIQFAYDMNVKIIDYISSINLKGIKSDKDISSVVEILKNIHIMSLKFKRSEHSNRQITDIELKMEKENKKIKEKYILFLTEDFPKIITIYEKIKAAKSQNLRNFIFSLFSDIYLDNLFAIYNHFVSYIKKDFIGKKSVLKSSREKYIKISDVFYKISGIPVKAFIDFKANWQLVEMEFLYNGIISDGYYKESPQKQNSKDKEKSSYMMNSRQRTGNETPKRGRKTSPKKTSDNYSNSENSITVATSANNSNIKIRRPSADSLDIREERSKKTQFKGIKSKNRLPVPGAMKLVNIKVVKDDNANVKENLDNLTLKIKLIIFNRIKGYYNSNKKGEVDCGNKMNFKQIKMYQIKKVDTKERKYEKNEGKEKNILFKNMVKPFNIGKYDKKAPVKPVKSNKKDIAKAKDVTMKSKLDELTEQLNKYENLANNLGKDYENNKNK